MPAGASLFSLSDEKDAAGDGESDAAWRGVRLGLGRIEGVSSEYRLALSSSTEAERFAKRAISLYDEV